MPLEETILYEVHIGTATPEGTFEAFIDKLSYLKSLGITAIEIMPVADFPGDRNWAYDGVCLFAPARAYGGPLGMKKLVDEAHNLGIAVVQDVVYNHLGPDGNYLRDFSREYFTDAMKTPWGDAVNFATATARLLYQQRARLGTRVSRGRPGLDVPAPSWTIVKCISSRSTRHAKRESAKDRHFTIFADESV